MAEDVLDLSKAPSTLFLFGLAGSGKSFVGDLIAEHTGRFIYHADSDLTDTMKRALALQRPFTETMRDEFFATIVEKIRQMRCEHQQLVVTQAVYKRRHRALLNSAIPDMEFIMVDAQDGLIAKRLKQRTDGISQYSAAALRSDFEPPDVSTKILQNNRDRQHIIKQLNAFYCV